MWEYDLGDAALVAIVTLALEGQTHLRLAQPSRSVGEVLTRRAARPVRVDREADQLAVEIQLSVDYGQPIPALARQAQRLITDALQASTGLRVRHVNVHVMGVEYREAPHAP
jgi:uncharacterized alkaline shock family protein YloU